MGQETLLEHLNDNPDRRPVQMESDKHGNYGYIPPPSKREERGEWTNKTEYMLSVIGEIIGLGNVWRFPYLCFKNGGGAFLVPYVVFLVFCGIPIFFLEVSLGQLTSQGSITCWRKLCPLFEGLGYGGILLMLYTVMYYIVILAWALLYLFSSFHSVLPWATCNNTWNTENCADFNLVSLSHGNISGNTVSSVEEFWQRRILGLSGGLEEIGSLRWDLAGCLSLSWIVCYFCIWKGVKTTGKVAYFTATFPYAMLIVLLIRGLTLPGAADGIQFYLNPDLTRLSDPIVRYEMMICIFLLLLLILAQFSKTTLSHSIGSLERVRKTCLLAAVH